MIVYELVHRTAYEGEESLALYANVEDAKLVLQNRYAQEMMNTRNQNLTIKPIEVNPITEMSEFEIGHFKDIDFAWFYRFYIRVRNVF